MRRPLTWLFLALFAAGSSAVAPACSDNEPSLPASDMGGMGGVAGSAGPSTTGITPAGGTSNGGGAVTNSGLGVGCASDGDCETGLKCRRSDRDSLGPGGPAHGMCTLDCGVSEDPTARDEFCQDFDINSLCFPFSEDDHYCVQKCTFGVETNKCQNRVDDFMCRGVVHDIDGADCSGPSDCGSGEGCYEDGDGPTCYAQPTVCLPQCNTDDDCTTGRFCDVGLGLCVGDEPTSKRFGEPCDPDAEVDECAGFCDPDFGFCQEYCSLGTYPVCNSESTTNGDAACLLVPAGDVSFGDSGQCAKLCDCTDDCPNGLECIQLEDNSGPVEFLGRPGLCFIAGAGETLLNQCDGAGGAGGQGGASGDE